jgi:hypothetical protein
VEKVIKSTLIAQTEILFLNIDETLKSIEEPQLNDNKICDWPMGEQIYHMLSSLDQWFVNPYNYQKSSLDLKKNKAGLSRSDLVEYSVTIKNKILQYLENISIDSLSEYPQDCKFNRLTLILGQFRHLMYHIGLIHGCLRTYTGGTNPAYHGLGPPIKPTAARN